VTADPLAGVLPWGQSETGGYALLKAQAGFADLLIEGEECVYGTC